MQPVEEKSPPSSVEAVSSTPSPTWPAPALMPRSPPPLPTSPRPKPAVTKSTSQNTLGHTGNNGNSRSSKNLGEPSVDSRAKGPPKMGVSLDSGHPRAASLEETKSVAGGGGRRVPMGKGIQRQASLPMSPANGSPLHARFLNNNKLPPKIAKGLVRTNSDPKILPSSEESRLDTLDEIDLLHKIAKTPNILKEGGPIHLDSSGRVKLGGSGVGGTGSGGIKPPGKPGLMVPPGKGGKNKLVKQKSLNRTLSTSVLRIPKKRSFWSSA